jgi:hypothetical protein
MEDDNPDTHHGSTSDNMPDPAPCLDAAEQASSSNPPNAKTRQQKENKKWSLRRHWEQATSAQQLKWVLEGGGFLIALCVLGTYITGCIQTQRNFNRDHRAYLVANIATIHTATSTLEVTLENPGHSIAQNVTVHANEATMNLNSLDGSIQNRMVNGWGEFNMPPILPTLGKTSFTVPLPGLDMERIKDAKQFIYVAIRVSYVDEVSGERQSIPPICMRSAVTEPAREIQWTMCDPSAIIPRMEQWDEGENQKYKWPTIPD